MLTTKRQKHKYYIRFHVRNKQKDSGTAFWSTKSKIKAKKKKQKKTCQCRILYPAKYLSNTKANWIFWDIQTLKYLSPEDGSYTIRNNKRKTSHRRSVTPGGNTQLNQHFSTVFMIIPLRSLFEGKRRRVTEGEMVGKHLWFNGHELGQTLGDSEGQGGLVCCSPRGLKELGTTQWLNSKESF